ncbi:MAG: tol-pal system protein YbgF [Deltaproteobacteria bacterium]|nr:tol-pal system protein YbgF [Deltaproteobacteria bacterium]
MSKRFFIPMLFLGAVLYGCGPGFPIMTAEQENLMKNVDRIVKENEELKARVASLEGGGAAEIRKGFEDIKRSVAETNNGLEDLRHQLSFVKGDMEGADRDRTQLKAALDSMQSSIRSADERLTKVEESADSGAAGIRQIKDSLEANAKKIGELGEAVSAIEKKAVAAEAKRPEQAAKKEPAEPADSIYAKAYKDTLDKEYPKATEGFRTFLVHYPDHKLAGNAQYWIGEIYYAKGDWEMAILEFDKAIKKYPGSEKLPAAILKQGFSFEKLGSKNEAKVLLEEVVERFPKSPEAGIAKKRLAAWK